MSKRTSNSVSPAHHRSRQRNKHRRDSRSNNCRSSTGTRQQVPKMTPTQTATILCNGGYSQFEEWLFKLQAYRGLTDRDFDFVLQLAQAATRQIEDADFRRHMYDVAQATKATDRGSNICPGPAARVLRQQAGARAAGNVDRSHV